VLEGPIQRKSRNHCLPFVGCVGRLVLHVKVVLMREGPLFAS